jgi:tetratricopeptide (TPR) repeat protein
MEMNRHEEKWELNQAVELYRVAIQQNETDAWAHCHLGVVLGRLGDWEEAVASLLKAIRLVPDFALAHRHLGSLHQQAGYDSQAALHLKRADRLESEAQARAAQRQRRLSRTCKWITAG